MLKNELISRKFIQKLYSVQMAVDLLVHKIKINPLANQIITLLRLLKPS